MCRCVCVGMCVSVCLCVCVFVHLITRQSLSVLWWLLLQVYRERVLAVAVNCARLAAKDNVKKFIHFSTAQVYDSHKVGGTRVRVQAIFKTIVTAFPPPLLPPPPLIPLFLSPSPPTSSYFLFSSSPSSSSSPSFG